jgi:hypothetical protein
MQKMHFVILKLGLQRILVVKSEYGLLIGGCISWRSIGDPNPGSLHPYPHHAST